MSSLQLRYQSILSQTLHKMATDLWIWRRQTQKMPQQSFEVSLPHKRPQNGYPQTQVLSLEGIVLEAAQKFDLLLKNGYTGQIYFRFDPLFNRRFVPRRNQKTTKIQQQGDLPFTSGKPFSIDVESEGTTITVKVHMRGEEIYEFIAHDNLKQVTAFEVTGDILIHDSKRSTPLIPLPYLRPIQGFTDPDRVRIIGSAYDGPKKRFEVNLRDAKGDYLFHFAPEFSRNQVVRDTTKDKKWLNKQEVDGGFPFQLGKLFTVDFISDGKLIKIRVDGEPFCEFLPREGDDMSSISELEVKGEILLNEVTFFPEEKLKLPYEVALDGFGSGKRVRIVGAPKAGRGSFEVRFVIDEKNVMLDYQPYFESYKHYVGRWIMQDTVWRMVESDGGFPFEQSRQFQLDFQSKDKLIEVYVDGRKHIEFVPREGLDASSVTKLVILPADSMQLHTVVKGELEKEAES